MAAPWSRMTRDRPACRNPPKRRPRQGTLLLINIPLDSWPCLGRPGNQHHHSLWNCKLFVRIRQSPLHLPRVPMAFLNKSSIRKEKAAPHCHERAEGHRLKSLRMHVVHKGEPWSKKTEDLYKRYALRRPYKGPESYRMAHFSRLALPVIYFPVAHSWARSGSQVKECRTRR